MTRYIKKFINDHGFQLLVQIIFMAGALITAYYTIKQDITLLVNKVNNIEASLDDRPDLVKRFIVVETKVDDLIKVHEKLDAHLIRIENKIDALKK